jgi:hypothetical protein
MNLVCKKDFVVPFGYVECTLFFKNKTYNVLTIKQNILILETEIESTIGFKKTKNQLNKFAPNFIGDFFYYNPENTRFVIIEK